jgi:O-antigen/teichoic acid export membrane protein
VFIRKYLKFDRSIIDRRYWKYAVFDSAPFGISLLLNTLMVQVDRLILSVLSTPVSVGYYSLAYRLFEFILVIPTFYMNSVYAHMIVIKNKSMLEYKHIFKNSILTLSLSAVIITIVSLIIAPIIIPLVWGEEMKQAVLPFVILTLGCLVFYLTSPLNWRLVADGKQKYLPFIYGIVLIVNIILNLIFIPMYDYKASAVITVLSEVIVLIMLLYVCYRKI